MQYTFWDYLGSGLIVAAFLLPFIGAILIQVSVFLVAMFVSFTGAAESVIKAHNTRRTIRVTLNDYDEDEDR
jgi:hypothetical protein